MSRSLAAATRAHWVGPSWSPSSVLWRLCFFHGSPRARPTASHLLSLMVEAKTSGSERPRSSGDLAPRQPSANCAPDSAPRVLRVRRQWPADWGLGPAPPRPWLHPAALRPQAGLLGTETRRVQVGPRVRRATAWVLGRKARGLGAAGAGKLRGVWYQGGGRPGTLWKGLLGWRGLGRLSAASQRRADRPLGPSVPALGSLPPSFGTSSSRVT